MTRKCSEVAPSTYEGYEHITARLLPYFRKLDLTMDEISAHRPGKLLRVLA